MTYVLLKNSIKIDLLLFILVAQYLDSQIERENLNRIGIKVFLKAYHKVNHQKGTLDMFRPLESVEIKFVISMFTNPNNWNNYMGRYLIERRLNGIFLTILHQVDIEKN